MVLWPSGSARKVNFKINVLNVSETKSEPPKMTPDEERKITGRDPAVLLPAVPLVIDPTPLVEMKPVKPPPSGIMHAKKGGSAIVPFGVTTPLGEHYLIRLVNEDGKKREITFFVRADSHFEGKVPLGKYRIVGVHGSTWYGEKNYFGAAPEESKFFKARMKDGEEVFTFWKDATTAHGKTLTFKSVADGNMHSAPIDRAEFENN
jgi:hypothetical protein